MKRFFSTFSKRGSLWVWGACFLSLLPFWEFLLPGSVLLYRDLSFTDLPAKSFWLQSILNEGSIPRWNHLQYAGAPFYADLVAGPLHPLNFIFLLFGIHKLPEALTSFVLVHYPLMFLGFFSLFRFFRLRKEHAVLCALMATWSGFSLSAHSLTHILLSVTCMPWIALFWLSLKKASSFLGALKLSLALALPIYGGETFTPVIFAAGIFLDSLFSKQALRNVGLCLGVGSLSFLAAAAQLFPTMEFLSFSSRLSQSMAYPSASFSNHPVRFWDFIAPSFLGDLNDINTFWGADYSGRGRIPFFINSIYLGLLPIFVFLWMLFSGSIKKHLSKSKRVAVYLSVALLFLFASMGPWFPVDLIQLARKLLPALNGFRYPERLSIFFSFIVMILFALSFKRFLLWMALSKRSLPLHLSVACILGVLIFAATLPTPNSHHPLVRSSLMAALFWIVLFARNKRFKFENKTFWALLLLIVSTDALTASRGMIFFFSRSIADQENFPHLLQIKKSLGERSEEIRTGGANRLFSLSPMAAPWWDKSTQVADTSKVELLGLASWEGVHGNISTHFGLPNISGYYSVSVAGKEELNQLSFAHPKITKLLGAQYIISRPSNRPPVVHLQEDAMSNFFFATQAEFMADQVSIFKEWLYKDYQKNRVILEGAGNPLQYEEHPTIALKDRTNRSIEFSLKAQGDLANSFFVLNESFYPAWQASFQGAPLDLVRVNGWSMGVSLPPLKQGEYLLRFEYSDRWIVLGQILTGIFFLLFLFPWLGLDRFVFRNRYF